MATGSGTQNLRKAIGAIKDSTMVGMAKVNSEYKKLDVSILKATNHDEVLPKEKHVRTILGSISGSRSRSVVSYCIHMLTRRLAKTRSWPVALKTLIVIHRALREVDQSFCEELIIYENSGGRMLNMVHFKDDSSPSAWDNSHWIRAYSLYLEECLQCYRVLKYDFHRDHSRTKKLDTDALIEQLPALQQLLLRLLDCEPIGAARYDYMISCTLSIVSAESVRLYVAITDGVLHLVDKFFEMPRRQAVRALEIYRKSMQQAERLSVFYEMCRSLNISQKYVKIQQPPTSFLEAMEEYVKDAPDTLMLTWRPDNDNIMKGKDPEANLEGNPNEDGESPKPEDSTEIPPLIPDLLSWDEMPAQTPSEPDGKDPISLLLPEEFSNPSNPELPSEPAGWELALVETSQSDVGPVRLIKDGGLDRSTLDSLYDMPSVNTAPVGPNYMAPPSSNPFEASECNPEIPVGPTLREQPNYYQMAAYQQQYQQAEQLVFGYDYMQMAGIQPQQAAFVEQPNPQEEQSMVVYDYMQLAGIPQQAPRAGQQQEPSIPDFSQMAGIPKLQDHDSTQMAEIPKSQELSTETHKQQQQQQQQPEIGRLQVTSNGSGNPFSLGDPVVASGPLPHPSQTQSSDSSLI